MAAAAEASASAPRSSGTGPRWPAAAERAEHPADADPRRCAGGTARPRAGSPGRQVAGRGITWGGTGRDISRTLPVPCSPRPRAGGTARRPSPGASLRSRTDDVTRGSAGPGRRAATGTTPSTWATASSPRATAPRTTGTGILPDVTGRSVLDIGAWDGKYSFLAEQAGASRVVALDHYAWGVDFAARGAYWAECIQSGQLPDHRATRRTSGSPTCRGGAGFELAKAALGSKVEPLVADFQTVDLDEVGRVRRRALPRRAVSHEGAADLPRARARRDEGGGRHRDRGGPPGRASRARCCCSSTPAARCAPTSGTGTCRRSRRCTTCAGRPASPRCAPSSDHRHPPHPPRPPPRPTAPGSGWRGGSAASRPRCPHPHHPRRRRGAPTTEPSSTPSPDVPQPGPKARLRSPTRPGRYRLACRQTVQRSYIIPPMPPMPPMPPPPWRRPRRRRPPSRACRPRGPRW